MSSREDQEDELDALVAREDVMDDGSDASFSGEDEADDEASLAADEAEHGVGEANELNDLNAEAEMWVGIGAKFVARDLPAAAVPWATKEPARAVAERP
jgi:hypothetical protein